MQIINIPKQAEFTKSNGLVSCIVYAKCGHGQLLNFFINFVPE